MLWQNLQVVHTPLIVNEWMHFKNAEILQDCHILQNIQLQQASFKIYILILTSTRAI